MDKYPPPGPELDALVAEATMAKGGLTYSTTGDGMLKMLEWIRAVPRLWGIMLYSPLQGEIGEWDCEITAGRTMYCQEGATAPHAVALALLDAAAEENP